MEWNYSPYKAEVVCKGMCEKGGIEVYKTYVRTILARDDIYPCPIYASGVYL